MSGTTVHPTPARREKATGPSPLGWGLTALLREWGARVKAAAADLPQGSRGYQVLREVIDSQPPNQATLAARLGIDRTVMTYLIDSLVESGLVERTPDPLDRRARRIVITEHGRNTVNEIDAHVAEAESGLLAALDPSEREQLLGLIERAAGGLVHDDERCATAARAID